MIIASLGFFFTNRGLAADCPLLRMVFHHSGLGSEEVLVFHGLAQVIDELLEGVLGGMV